MDKFYVASTTPLTPGSNGLATALDVKLEYGLILDLEKFVATGNNSVYNYERPVVCYFNDNANEALAAIKSNTIYWSEGDEVYGYGNSPEHAFASLSAYLTDRDLLP